MKIKIVGGLLTAILLLSMSVFEVDSDNIKVIMNGTELVFDVQPQITNGRTLVSICAIAESFDANVTWDEADQTIFIETGESDANMPSPASNRNNVFQVSEITDQAKFYPIEIDSVQMKVLAVKAPDGTIRTAFNTCQVCFRSGRGYYIQEGDVLVC